MSERAHSLTLCAVGDIALGGMLEGRADTRAQREELVAAAQPLFAAADLGFADLDCTFDIEGEPLHPDEYRVTASPDQLDVLEELGVDIVAMANNHSFDHGWVSAQATRKELDRRAIRSVGVGENLADARKPAILERKGLRVGFLAYASAHPWVGAHPAGHAHPGPR